MKKIYPFTIAKSRNRFVENQNPNYILDFKYSVKFESVQKLVQIACYTLQM